MNEQHDRIGALGGKKVLVLLLGCAVVMIGSGVIAFIIVRLFDLKITDGTPFFAVVALWPSVALIAWIYGGVAFWAKATPPSLGLRDLSWQWALFAVFAGGLAAAASWLIILLTRPWLGEPRNVFMQALGPTGEVTVPLVIVLLLMGVVLAPLWEELAFRAILYRWLRGRMGIVLAATLSAIPHSMVHFDLTTIPALCVVFFCFALIYEWSRNLWVPILAHATNNSAAFLWVYVQLA